MSDCYLQFSEILSNLTEAEEAWLKEELEPGVGFEWEFDTDEEWDRHLWIYAEAFGDPEEVAVVVQKFLRQFRPYDFFTLTYSQTCSKMQVGMFSGGAVFVTAKDIEYQSANDFLAKRFVTFD